MTVRFAFEDQARNCAALGSPFMERLMTLCARRLTEGTAVTDRVLGWQGDATSRGASVPLRLAGALHGLVLDGADPALGRAYPPARVDDDTLWDAVETALRTHETRLLSWMELPPQTNEVRRSAALIAAALWLADRVPLPLVLSELGASAGLNLSFDRFELGIGKRRFGTPGSPVRLAPDWAGDVPPTHPVRVAERAGVDLHPLDLGDPMARLRLLAYLWPDQPHRLTLTKAAIALATARPDIGDAADWLRRRLARPYPGCLHMVFNTVAWQYFPPERQSAARAALDAAGQRATAEAPLAHVAMEADSEGPGAALTVELWAGDRSTHGPVSLGRCDFHGRWIEWRA